MNKQQQLDLMIVRAKIHAQEAVKKYIENWFAEEPKEASGGNSTTEEYSE